MMRTLIRSLLSLSGIALCLAASAQARYRVVDLGAFPDGEYEYFPSRITNQTQIVGFALGSWPAPDRAFLWEPKTGYTNLLPAAGTSEPRAMGIGPHGQIVGGCFVYSGAPQNYQATIWDASHNPSLLGPMPTYESFALDMAVDGTIYGDFDFMPAVWAPDGSLSFLPGLDPDFPFGQAGRLNKAGDILGLIYDSVTFAPTAVVWDRAHHITAIDIPATPPERTSATGLDINEQGTVAGYASISSYYSNAQRGFVWSRSTGTTLLPGLGGSPEVTYAESINNRGQIVGSSIPQNGFFTSAVLWENGQVKDLNTLIGPWNGWFLSTADGINDRGQITGFGVYTDPAHTTGPFLLHAYLLDPL